MKPSNFISYPWYNIFRSHDAAIVAHNIMVVLFRNGDEWRKISWEEYMNERLIDNDFSAAEKSLFDEVVPYTISPESAVSFCDKWFKN